MRGAPVGLTVLFAGVASLGCAPDSEVVWEGTAPLTVDPGAVAAPGERAWKVDLQFDPPLAVKKDSKDDATYAVIARFPAPIGTDDTVTGAVMALVPEIAERRGPPLAVAGKETYLKRTLRASVISRVTVRITTKAGTGGEPAGPVTFTIAEAKCITRLGDEWQSDQFGIEPVPLANSSECVPR